jgi:hypothetical protein
MSSFDLQQKSLAVIAAIADIVARNEEITIAPDWGYGTATLVRQDGSHTHVGGDHGNTNEENLAMFVNGLHDQLVNNRGLSWVASVITEVQP